VVVWAVAAVLFAVLLILAQEANSGLDDPDPALQRPGLLDVGDLPQPAPPVTPELPHLGRRSVVFFVRPTGVDELCRRLTGDRSGGQTDVVVVVSGPGRCEGLPAVNDPADSLARAFGMRRPRAGGAPVGYAVVDSGGQIRYRTLDPTVTGHLGEVETILRATP